MPIAAAGVIVSRVPLCAAPAFRRRTRLAERIAGDAGELAATAEGAR
ncbi:hypothetical protein ACRS6B_25125 [Nocardia asteroides]